MSAVMAKPTQSGPSIDVRARLCSIVSADTAEKLPKPRLLDDPPSKPPHGGGVAKQKARCDEHEAQCPISIFPAGVHLLQVHTKAIARAPELPMGIDHVDVPQLGVSRTCGLF